MRTTLSCEQSATERGLLQNLTAPVRANYMFWARVGVPYSYLEAN